MGEARATPLSFGLVPGMGSAEGQPYPTSNIGFDINAQQPQPGLDLPVGRLFFHLGGANVISPCPNPISRFH